MCFVSRIICHIEGSHKSLAIQVPLYDGKAAQMSATEYLNGTVGNLLVQGVASTVASNPSDPVEFLAEWLLR
jgi:hypothetical protein